MADEKPPEDALSDLRRRVSAARSEGAIIVGALLGYGVDTFVHTSPWGLVTGLTLGFAAGVVNVVRVAQSYSRSNPVGPDTPSAPDDEED
jgi:ATP synthase protein I